MKIKRNYQVCVSFGDGKPKTTEVVATSGVEAIDTAKSLHPGSRTVHLLGITDAPAKVAHPFFDEDPDPMENPSDYIRRRRIDACIRMRKEGKTHRDIADSLGIGKTTVSTWIKQYG
jgi:DNA-binding NarL/FixJ family response regulator